MMSNDSLSAGIQQFWSLPVFFTADTDILKQQISKVPELWHKAADFLRRDDLDTLPAGKYRLSDDGLYANVQEYVTCDDAQYENHRKYADVQFAVSGEEEIFITPVEACGLRTAEYDGEKDIEFFQNAASAAGFRADRNHIAVIFPGQAHKPCISPEGKRTPVRKIVIKIPFLQ